jgi:hypothetical protein
LVQWLLNEPEGGTRGRPFDVPAFAAELCLHHSLWMLAPLEVSVPILCWTTSTGEEEIRAWPYHELLVYLSLDALLYAPTASFDEFGMWQDDHLQEPGPYVIVLATVFEYVASTYGSDQVPLLLAAIPEHQRAETLIPAVFGVSVEEFTAGWRAFLAEEYAITQ